MKHAPEPWVAKPDKDAKGNTGFRIDGETVSFIAWLPDGAGSSDQRANADRVVACVNALKGKNPKAVADVVYALEAMVAHYCDLMPLSDSQRARLDEEARTALDFLET